MKIQNKIQHSNKKGFTLVELLAVIVVLAIIMIIAIPSVMDTMNNAKKSSLKVFAEKALNVAQSKYMADQMIGAGAGSCKIYTLAELGVSDGGGKYTGTIKAVFTASQEKQYSYEIVVHDEQFMINDATYEQVISSSDAGAIVAYNASTFKTLSCS